MILLGLLLAASAASHAALDTLPAGAVLIDPHAAAVDRAAVDALANASLSAIARGDVDAALMALRDPSDAVLAELAAARVIDALQAQPGTRATERALIALRDFPTRVFRRHEETTADWFVPLVDVAGKADALLRMQQLSRDRDRLLLALQGDAAAAIVSTTKDARVLVAAIDAAPEHVLDRVAAAALSAPVSMPSPAWSALARRRPDQPILDAALRFAQPVDLLPLFEQLPARLPTDRAVAWLKRASESDAIGSAALLALGELAATSSAALDELDKHIGRADTGASAAFALARLPATLRGPHIDALIDKATTPAQFSDLALALRLDHSDAARERLARLADDPRIGASLAKELRR
jgi:hypothetical protein